MSEPTITIASAITAGAIVAATPSPMILGMSASVLGAAAFGAILYTIANSPGDHKRELVSFLIGTSVGVVGTAMMEAFAPAYEVTRPLVTMQKWPIAGILGALGNIIWDRAMSFAKSAKLPGEGK